MFERFTGVGSEEARSIALALTFVRRSVGSGTGAPAVTGYLVKHPSGAPSMGLRVECDDKTLAYTGDTEWVDDIVAIGRGADILLAEAYWYERKVPYHLDYSTLRDRLGLIGAKRDVLTHMSADMLSRDPQTFAGCELAHDGLAIDLGG